MCANNTIPAVLQVILRNPPKKQGEQATELTSTRNKTKPFTTDMFRLVDGIDWHYHQHFTIKNSVASSATPTENPALLERGQERQPTNSQTLKDSHSLGRGRVGEARPRPLLLCQIRGTHHPNIRQRAVSECRPPPLAPALAVHRAGDAPIVLVVVVQGEPDLAERLGGLGPLLQLERSLAAVAAASRPAAARPAGVVGCASHKKKQQRRDE